ncbi:MAG TPA: sensor histidine kinase [Chthoniobacteraceae bacterium]|nr:sensor histidine kinase [Chthoniobacteraceae bacterium]
MHLITLGSRLSQFVGKRSKYAILVGCFAVVALIGILDYMLPYQVSMSVFYTLPIMFAAWYADKKSGDLIAIVSLIITWWTDELTAPPEALGWIHTYRMLVRLFFFLFFSMGMAGLKARRDLKERQIELLEHNNDLEREIIRISEHEQARMGRDLHDGLCQYLAAISCAAASLRNDLRKQLLEDEALAAAEIAELLKQGVTQARNLARGLSPVYEDAAGLDSALHELADNTTRLMNIDCEFEPGAHVYIHDNAVAGHLYRIAQEALNNAVRHGGATRVVIGLWEQAGQVTLCVSDNGSGLPAGGVKSGGMGLNIMDYRARMIGGQLRVEEDPGVGGVRVTCTFRQEAAHEVVEEFEHEPAGAGHALTA